MRSNTIVLAYVYRQLNSDGDLLYYLIQIETKAKTVGTIKEAAQFLKETVMPQKKGVQIHIISKPLVNMILEFGKDPIHNKPLDEKEEKELVEYAKEGSMAM